MKQKIKERLLGFIIRNFMVEKEAINLDKSLIDEGIIDSFGLIEIASFLEEEFSMEVNEDDMNRDNFGSVDRIIDFIYKQMTFDISDS
ncbi:MAG: acyl carrier protein [Bacteroidetes bacterium]|nr:acyl carrier protein [Bacteroidota bacterium]